MTTKISHVGLSLIEGLTVFKLPILWQDQGLDVSSMMNTWTSQMGFPVINVSRRDSNPLVLDVQQQRFLIHPFNKPEADRYVTTFLMVIVILRSAFSYSFLFQSYDFNNTADLTVSWEILHQSVWANRAYCLIFYSFPWEVPLTYVTQDSPNLRHKVMFKTKDAVGKRQ